MRKIKFRAWDDQERRWLFGYKDGAVGGFSLFGETVLLGEWASVLNGYASQRDNRRFEDLNVMQGTCLKDRNGKGIYEGDVVDIDEQPVQVEWHNGAWTVEYFTEPKLFYLSQFDASDVEVIGNIYDNPRLPGTCE